VVFPSKQNMCRCLHMIWICLPPESGNWRRGDFHPSSYAALSAAHGSGSSYVVSIRHGLIRPHAPVPQARCDFASRLYAAPSLCGSA
jgi:hypothetical protein